MHKFWRCICGGSYLSPHFLFLPDWNADVMAETAVVKLEPSVEIAFYGRQNNKTCFFSKEMFIKNIQEIMVAYGSIGPIKLNLSPPPGVYWVLHGQWWLAVYQPVTIRRNVSVNELYVDVHIIQVDSFPFTLRYIRLLSFDCCNRFHRLGGQNSKHLYLTDPEAEKS